MYTQCLTRYRANSCLCGSQNFCILCLKTVIGDRNAALKSATGPIPVPLGLILTLIKLYDMFSDYFKHNKTLIEETLNNLQYPNTALALKRFYYKNQSISNVLQTIDCKTDNYTVYLLVRCFIEHFLVIFYIWSKYRLNENDKTATTYYEDYAVQELFKRINYSKTNKINSKSKYSRLLLITIDKLKEKGLLKQKHLDKLNEAKNEFNIRKISKFIETNIPKDINLFITSSTVKGLLESYNYYSSFVHGGPSADLAEFESKDDTIMQIAEDFKKWAENLLSIQRLFILYFLAYENEKIKHDLGSEIERMSKKSAKPNKQ